MNGKNILFFSLLLAGSSMNAFCSLQDMREFFKRVSRNPLVWFSDNFHEVQESRCYRSKTLPADALEKYVQEKQLKTILNLREADATAEWFCKEKEIAEKHCVHFYTVTLDASRPPTKEEIQKILNIFNGASVPLLIHCAAGADRTGMISALWVLEKMNGTLDEALKQQELYYGHFRFVYPCMREFTERWYQLKQRCNNNIEQMLEVF